MNDSLAKTRRRRRLLVVDCDPNLALVARELLAREPVEVLAADDAAGGLEMVRSWRPDVVLLGHLRATTDGLEALAAIRSCDTRLPILWVTGSSSSEAAIAATRAGAFDFLTRPIDSAKLVQQVQHALDSRKLMLAPVEIANATDQPQANALLGRSPAMQEVYKSIGRLAALDVPILLVGESGTGKQLAARTLHQHGQRSDKPLLHIRCRDDAPGQLATRLFGEQLVDGAERMGEIDHAAGGTLFLENLDAIDLATQTRLLRLAQQRTFTRVGGEAPIAADVAIMISTQDDPETLLHSQLLHSDFYFLFRPFSVNLPALRDRKEDVPLLVEHFIRAYSNIHKSFGNDVVRVSSEALDLLQAHDWPGNVAELQAVVRRALVETQGTILATDDLRRLLRKSCISCETTAAMSLDNASDQSTDWKRFVGQRIAQHSTEVYADAMTEMESHVIREVLTHTRGNQAQAAKILGITRTSLRKRVQAFGYHNGQAAAG